jgi:hypothetical protein
LAGGLVTCEAAGGDSCWSSSSNVEVAGDEAGDAEPDDDDDEVMDLVATVVACGDMVVAVVEVVVEAVVALEGGVVFGVGINANDIADEEDVSYVSSVRSGSGEDG